MDNYVDLLRNILKNFDNDEFDDVIKNILNKIFNHYYMNRNDKVYCIDNLYKKYDLSRYNFIKKKYGLVKNNNLIYRFNKYSKRAYIKKLLKSNEYFNLDEGENIIQIVDNILQVNTSNYKKYIDHMYLEKFLNR